MKVLNQGFYICYLVQFWKKIIRNALILINFNSKVNAMALTYAAKLGLQVQKTNICNQKIVSFLLETYGMIIAIF